MNIDVSDYVYSGLQVIYEMSDGVHERHIYAGDMHVASNTTGTVEDYHATHRGLRYMKLSSKNE